MHLLRKNKHCMLLLLVLALILPVLFWATYVWAESVEMKLADNQINTYLSATEEYTPGITKLKEPESFTILADHIDLDARSTDVSQISTLGLQQNGVTVMYQERVDTFLRPDSDKIGNGTPTDVNPACAIKYIQDDSKHGESLDINGNSRCRYVYCTEFEKNSPAGQVLTNSGYLNRFVHYVLYYGAVYYGETCRHDVYSTGNWRYDYLVTQMAIHVVNNEFTLENLIKGINLSNASDFDKKLVIDRITAMVNDAYAVGDTPHLGWDSEGWFRTDYPEYTSFTLSTTADNWTSGGDGYYYSDWITPLLTTKNGYYANHDISYISHEASDGAVISKKYSNTSYSPYRLAIPWESYEEWRETGHTLTSTVTIRTPSHWKVSQFATSGGNEYQNVCFITSSAQEVTYRASVSIKISPAKGNLKVQKISLVPDITENNPNYSLEGAVFELYKIESDGSLIKMENIYKTDAEGSFSVINLPVGDYKLKEISAPKGYLLDADYSENITVAADQTTNATISNTPKSLVVPMVLQKIDAETGLGAAQGKGTLANAEFTVRYYSEIMDTDPALLGKKPDRTWVIKTNKFGYSELSDTYFVSGDEYYRDVSGSVTCPYGTLTICETKTPDGYKLDEKTYVVKIYEDESGEIVHTNTPIIKEQITQIKVIKKQDGTEFVLPDVEFELIFPDGTKESARTDENGEVVFKGLLEGKYILKETSTKDNYVLAKDTVTFAVDEKHNIVNGMVVSAKDDSSGAIDFEYDSIGNGVIYFGNKPVNYSLQIHKTDNKNLPLSGAEFTIYEDKERAVVFAKDRTAEGKLCFDNLQPGVKYYLAETEAPNGYLGEVDENDKPLLYEVYAEVNPEDGFVFWVNQEKYGEQDSESQKQVYFSEAEGKKELNIKIINMQESSIPETGDGSNIVLYTALILGSLVVLCLLAFVLFLPILGRQYKI